ncbi:MAG: translation initiation factor IF-2, partial [Kordiimonadales bacterium]
MSDSDGKKTLGLRGGARPGNVKQSFSHGRTKSVVVETKRKRVVIPKPGAGRGGSSAMPVGDPSRRPAGITDVEMARRLKAVQLAKAREAEDNAKRAAEEKEREESRTRRRAEMELKEREQREAEERAKAKVEEAERKKREAEVAAERAAAVPAEKKPSTAAPRTANFGRPAPAATPRKSDRERDQRQNRGKGPTDSRRSGKLTLGQATGGAGNRHRSMASMKRKQ